MSKYSHAYTIAFEAESMQEDGEDMTNEMLEKAILERVRSCMAGEDADLLECCGAPFDTYEI